MRVAVIGAGIIGVTAALALTERGHAVTIFDRQGVASGASGGNAGAFAFADVIPLATPGIIKKAPAWLFDPNGPLSIPPAYALKIAPWLLAFFKASLPARYRAAVAAQGALMDHSAAALERLVKTCDLEGLLRREGQLQLYEGEHEFRASLPGWQERRVVGVKFDLLEGPEAIAEIQPGLARRFTHAGFTPDWKNVTDPAVWTEAIAEIALTRGATLIRSEITTIRPTETGMELIGPGENSTFDRVVVAAGAHSGGLTQQLGLNLPLETERGYNVSLPEGAFDLRTHLTFAGHGFVVSRIGDGIRVGGGVELGGLELAPRMGRADALLAKAARFLPELRTAGGRRWMGFRPSMPDSLPVIDVAPGNPRVILAFGHGHLGLTQSAGTAEIVADLVDDAPPAIDMAPFRATRF
ncbi:D-amino-acid dehydrogenase [Pelagibacterium halotolerans]|uniref:D-amino acid dehydrogenase family protein in hydroxy-L-proline catabolic cluster n=2 Tax=Pelagibacterium TaxID=1082930 RepID=G4R771_PELHB|nr:FAD-binding oxidoreductase [Pelagibacterium halotolerans]AEQ50225.1 D-amino acid dehydrogenase family protein in hydroxy-L-proline catabolic cluster [Pelagibacterium halotolerans B2]QJR20695.1 FAD-binding oxidoreductase [Pelagibacterium halotolerans]SEA51173.1 D-amino-acid dehydrogenase [Pelagibacterium halotolerans]